MDNLSIGGKSRTSCQATIIVGAKTDLGDKRAVHYEEAHELASELKATYIEVSAAINTNVTAIFDRIIDELIPQDEFEMMDEEIEEIDEI